MSDQRNATPEELEILKRARRLLRSSGVKRTDRIEIKFGSVAIDQFYNEPSDTNILHVRSEGVKVIKAYDYRVHVVSSPSLLLPYVLSVLRENMLLEDLADV